MEQYSIFDFDNEENDPLYQKLLKVTKSKKIQVEHYSVILNENDIFEISSDEEHFPASSLEDCYKKIMNRLNDQE